ncbi:MAG: hypothetical protein WCV91_06320, partial [Candidatus Margulisiibacteriota bacterium]
MPKYALDVTRQRKGNDLALRYFDEQRELKAKKPKHLFGVDVGMEHVRGLSPEEIVCELLGGRPLNSIAELASIDVRQIAERIRQEENNPAGGAGGLGIVEQTLGWAGPRYGHLGERTFGLVNASLLHSTRRDQGFAGNRQRISFREVSPGKNDQYYYLGQPIAVTLYGEEVPADVFLFTGFNTGERFAPAFRLSVHGRTGTMYPTFWSQENFDQMQVLGQGGFRLLQHFGVLGVDEPLADFVIGHDGHTALFKFNMFLWFYKKLGNKEAALSATRRLCIATIHAPQIGTVPRTTGPMVGKHYTDEQERWYGEFGLDQGQSTNSLFTEINLSGKSGVVSPLHRMVTEAEVKARARGFGIDRPLLPNGTQPSSLSLFSDTIDIESWVGPGLAFVLDKWVPQWRENPAFLLDEAEVDRLILNPDFRRDFAEALAVQRQTLIKLLSGSLPKKAIPEDQFSKISHLFVDPNAEVLFFKPDITAEAINACQINASLKTLLSSVIEEPFRRHFGASIDPGAIILSSLRRATQYKISLLRDLFFDNRGYIESIAESLGRPIYWLFGGLAHHEDTQSIDALQQLIDSIGILNADRGQYTANFYEGYGYEGAAQIFPGLGLGGVMVGATNPVEGRSQASEAFGPSYGKIAANGGYCLAPYDGGGAVLSHLPTFHNYGFVTCVGGVSRHNDL